MLDRQRALLASRARVGTAGFQELRRTAAGDAVWMASVEQWALGIIV